MSQKKIQVTQSGPCAFPASKSDWLQLGLRKAGVTETELSSGIREAFDVNRELLKASKVELKAVGEEVHQIESPDNSARQRAVNAIYGLGGLSNGPKEDTGPKGPMFTLILPNYYSDDLIQKGEVVDVGDGHDSLDSRGSTGPIVDAEIAPVEHIPSPWEDTNGAI